MRCYNQFTKTCLSVGGKRIGFSERKKRKRNWEKKEAQGHIMSQN